MLLKDTKVLAEMSKSTYSVCRFHSYAEWNFLKNRVKVMATLSQEKTCPVCGVAIANDVVQFSNGSTGTRARLYARVCQYAKKPDCINQDKELIGEVLQEDGFIEAPPLNLG